MRFPLALLGALAVTLAALAADFPAPEKLPSKPDLPDPTVAFDGSKIESVKNWEENRRPELKALFEHYMYGKFPAKPEQINAKVLFEDEKAFDGKATLREMEIAFAHADWPKLYLLVAVPNGKTPSACFVGPNFGGNHLCLADDRIHLPTAWMPANGPGVKDNKATDAGRGKAPDVWPMKRIIDRGYAVATFYCGDLQPDRPNIREGMRVSLPQLKGEEDPAQTATIAWWAWGVRRAVDYLVSDSGIDKKRIAVVGHSRLGKTALLAGAFDDRIALVIPHQAGCGGTGPSRHSDAKAEPVKRINTAFPHWFCGNFKAFNDDPSKLPFDQNCLVALCAPRPVLFTNASEDLWANPSGQLKVLKAANPAYKLYGHEGLADVPMPKPGDPLIDSRLGYWIRSGPHSMNPDDWKIWMDFADKWLK